MMEEKQFGIAGQEIVIVVEEFLSGDELSFIGMVDGEHILPLSGSQDHKRLLNGDRGQNTGGYGGLFTRSTVIGYLRRKGNG
ncbi:hypothetical protein [Candidatus Coxiella mudrowiae]|uniref:hypothetical protein n=1 Tax=Candidatus Coxiella mudrowiae TaxID=2054173 RepID=UPI000B0E648F|nr:hypothetical protein [Candidatus Coxiella mudrowiae]